ncbi:hypothetical protein BDZ94DRAFT_1323746 [Collybia nuda]|uniref:Uncharacterized protein n=1 Tax=Collybia nuda TaxID=64659 RepID=A0A9P6CHG5_9AGAR|nr:hypothetical protein BDZ94DRAFT_1323746 [Collybia nuda]
MESSALSRQKSATKSAKGKGKQIKRFLGQNDALKLAASIAGMQEEKSLSKVEKHHQAQVGQPHEDRGPRMSTSRVKLKETKALLAAQRSRVKKDKAKLRKQMQTSSNNPPGDVKALDTQSGPVKQITRKTVSFA